MKKNTAFAVQPLGDETRSVRIERTAADRWRVAAADSATDRAMSDLEATVAWLLPNEDVKPYVTSFPRLGAREIARAAAGWVAREEGGQPDDWSLAWKALEPSRGGDAERQDVFLLYTARENVQKELARAAEARIRPRLMLPPYLVLDQFFRLCGEAGDLGAWNIVFLGADERFLSIATAGSLLMTRPLPRDLSEGGDPAEYLGRLVTEVDRSVSFARQTEQSPRVEKILVCGDPRLSADLVARMKDDLETPAAVWDLAEPFEGADPHDADGLLLLAAAALAAGDCEFDLGPGSARRLIGPRTRRRALVAAGALGVALVPILLGGSLLTTRIQEGYIERARERMQESEEQTRLARESYEAQRVMLAREQRIRRFTAKNPNFRSVLLRIADLTPPEVVYDELRVRELPDGRFFLQIEGAATARTARRAQASFLELLTALNGCEFLAGGGEPQAIEIAAEGRGDEARKQAVFTMEYQLLPPAAAQTEDRS